MQVAKVSRAQVVNNSLWKFFESIGVQAIQLIVTVILARILGPNDYGLMALVLVSVNFLGLFVNSSIASYLIYLRDIRKQEFLTALVSNLIVSVILYVLLFSCAEHIAVYYNAPPLANLLRVMAFVLPLNSISAIYNAYAQKMSLFRKLFVRNMIALPTSGVIALIAAYSGLGTWALVLQQLSYSFLLCIIVVLSIKVEIEGVWQIEAKQTIPMFRYGSMVLVSSFIAFISDNLSDLLIGKKINAEQLGYYNRGNHFPSTLSNVINHVIAGVLFPAFASYNSNIKELKDKFSKSVKLLYFLVLPLLLGMMACSEALVRAVLSEKWMEAVPIIQIMCIYYCAIPLLQTSSQINLAVGKLKLRMIGEIIKLVVTVLALFYFIDYGIIAVAIARLLVNFVLVLVTLYINRMIIGYGFTDFVKDIYRPLLLCIIMVVCIYPVSLISMSAWKILIMQLLLGTIIFLIIAKVFHIKEVNEVFSLVTHKLKK